MEITKETAMMLKDKNITFISEKGYYKHGTKEDFNVLLLWNNIEPNPPEFGNAPRQSEVQHHFRDKFKIHIVVNVGRPHRKDRCEFYSNVIKYGKHHKNKFRSQFFKNFEDALEKGIQESIKIINP
jgi:hypothetical protein